MSKSLIAILSTILAIGGTVALYILVMPKEKRNQLPKFLQWLHDLLNFKELLLEKLLKLLYVLSSTYMLFSGFFMLFGIKTAFGYVPTFGQGLVTMILGPILARLLYEGIMITVLLLKNVVEINGKLKGGVQAPAAVEEKAAPAEVAPDFKYCTKCGTRYDANKGGCPKCKD